MSNSRMKSIGKMGVWSYLLAGIMTSTLASVPTKAIGAEAIEQTQAMTQKSGERIRAILSSSSINRISFDKSPIAQIVGDESEYSVLTDDMGINIFLIPKVPAGEKIELTLISTTGAIADLTLHVADISGQVIEIGKGTSTGELLEHEKDSMNEIANMLRYMIKDEPGKYYIKQVKRKITSIKAQIVSNLNNANAANAANAINPTNINTLDVSNAELDIIQDRSYRFGNLSGARLVVKAKNLAKKKSVSLSETDFKPLFEGVRAVSITNKILSPGNSSFVYVIAQEAKHD